MAQKAMYKDGDKIIWGTERHIINYHELSPAWQAEARSNSDDYENISYLEPRKDHNPKEHILWDLSECMRVDDPNMDGVIGISNNSAMAVKLSADGDVAWVWFL